MSHVSRVGAAAQGFGHLVLPDLGTWCSQVWARWGLQPSVVLEPDAESPLPVAGAAPGRHFLHFLAAACESQPATAPGLGG